MRSPTTSCKPIIPSMSSTFHLSAKLTSFCCLDCLHSNSLDGCIDFYAFVMELILHYSGYEMTGATGLEDKIGNSDCLVNSDEIRLDKSDDQNQLICENRSCARVRWQRAVPTTTAAGCRQRTVTRRHHTIPGPEDYKDTLKFRFASRVFVSDEYLAQFNHEHCREYRPSISRSQGSPRLFCNTHGLQNMEDCKVLDMALLLPPP